jgi:hypothetical protein
MSWNEQAWRELTEILTRINDMRRSVVLALADTELDYTQRSDLRDVDLALGTARRELSAARELLAVDLHSRRVD